MTGCTSLATGKKLVDAAEKEKARCDAQAAVKTQRRQKVGEDFSRRVLKAALPSSRLGVPSHKTSRPASTHAPVPSPQHGVAQSQHQALVTVRVELQSLGPREHCITPHDKSEKPQDIVEKRPPSPYLSIANSRTARNCNLKQLS
jgi:hypothetical protein